MRAARRINSSSILRQVGSCLRLAIKMVGRVSTRTRTAAARKGSGRRKEGEEERKKGEKGRKKRERKEIEKRKRGGERRAVPDTSRYPVSLGRESLLRANAVKLVS